MRIKFSEEELERALERYARFQSDPRRDDPEFLQRRERMLVERFAKKPRYRPLGAWAALFLVAIFSYAPPDLMVEKGLQIPCEVEVNQIPLARVSLELRLSHSPMVLKVVCHEGAQIYLKIDQGTLKKVSSESPFIFYPSAPAHQIEVYVTKREREEPLLVKSFQVTSYGPK